MDGDGAPKVTAKGVGELADQILTVARDNDIPLHEDAVLTDVLSRVELDGEIPAALYLAVAEVIAFAYLVSGKTPPRPVKREEAGRVIDSGVIGEERRDPDGDYA